MDRIHGVFCVGLPASRSRLIEKLCGKYETRPPMVLETFEARKQTGEDPISLEFHEITQEDGAQYFRYMKATSTQPVCLACHGEKIPPEVKAELDIQYPENQARGFKLGDIRGAFTVKQRLE